MARQRVSEAVENPMPMKRELLRKSLNYLREHGHYFEHHTKKTDMFFTDLGGSYGVSDYDLMWSTSAWRKNGVKVGHVNYLLDKGVIHAVRSADKAELHMENVWSDWLGDYFVLSRMSPEELESQWRKAIELAPRVLTGARHPNRPMQGHELIPSLTLLECLETAVDVNVAKAHKLVKHAEEELNEAVDRQRALQEALGL